MNATPKEIVEHINRQIRMDNLIKGIVETDRVLQREIFDAHPEVAELQERVEELEEKLEEAEGDRDLAREDLNEAEETLTIARIRIKDRERDLKEQSATVADWGRRHGVSGAAWDELMQLIEAR